MVLFLTKRGFTFVNDHEPRIEHMVSNSAKRFCELINNLNIVYVVFIAKFTNYRLMLDATLIWLAK
jgi:hypothetical protein